MAAAVTRSPAPSSEGVRRCMQANRRTDTKPEVQLRSALQRLGMRFRKDHRIGVGGMRVRADIVFTRARVAVFVDGCFWHRCPQHGHTPRANRDFWEPKLARNVERDQQVTEALRAASWTVLRIWEHEAVEEAVALIASTLTTQGAARKRSRPPCLPLDAALPANGV